MARATDICNKCGNTGHWAKDCDISFDAYYKRAGKADKKKIFLDVKYRDKDFAKSHGARWDPDARKWFVWDRVPDALKEFEPVRTHTYIKPEKTIDGLCKYCFFSFEEGLVKSESDPKACIHCAPKKQPPACKHCNKFMVADTWTGNMDDDYVVIMHDCVGNPMMYGGGCSLMIGCHHRPQEDAIDIFRQRMARMDAEDRRTRDAVESALRAEFPDTIHIHRERRFDDRDIRNYEVIFDLDPSDSIDSFLEKHRLDEFDGFLPEPGRGPPWVFDSRFSHPRYRACVMDFAP